MQGITILNLATLLRGTAIFLILAFTGLPHAQATGDTTPPGQIQNLRIKYLGPNVVKLIWDERPAEEEPRGGYTIYRNGPAIVSGYDSFVYHDYAIVPGATYTYRVSVNDAAGNESELSDPLTVTVPDNEPPSQIQGLSLSSAQEHSIQIQWNETPAEEGPLLGYTIYRDGVAIDTEHGSPVYTDGTVSPGMTYEYRVSATDTSGNESVLSDGLVVTTPSTAPYCGDGIVNGDEQCDGTAGVGESQMCNASCQLVDLPGNPYADLLPNCGDGVCARPETPSVCPLDCGSLSIDKYTGQRAKYVVDDNTCPHNGNGLADVCAASSGAPGRFNELQAALDSLVPGDTLYIHPGAYWSSANDTGIIRDIFGIYEVTVSGTAENPVIITAADPANPPVLHSFDPSNASSFSLPALSVIDSAYVIVDGISVRGRTQLMRSQNSTLQNLECTHGWGICDGNWACLRVEGSSDSTVAHNHVHDVRDTEGACSGAAYNPREAGLKEFNSNDSIWEFNTVERVSKSWDDVPGRGYDFHRNGSNVILRFNRILADGIVVARVAGASVYGNLIMNDGEICLSYVFRDEEQPGAEHVVEFDHNTCAFMHIGVWARLDGDEQIILDVENNLFYTMNPAGDDANAALDSLSIGRNFDYNVYDDGLSFRSPMWDGLIYHSLTDWQSATGFDSNSIEGEDGYCEFVDPPTDALDTTFDMRVTESCQSLSSTGGEIGVYGITDCVGHECSLD